MVLWLQDMIISHLKDVIGRSDDSETWKFEKPDGATDFVDGMSWLK